MSWSWLSGARAFVSNAGGMVSCIRSIRVRCAGSGRIAGDTACVAGLESMAWTQTSDRAGTSTLPYAGHATVRAFASSAKAMAGTSTATRRPWSTVFTVTAQAHVARATEPASQQARPRMTNQLDGTVCTSCGGSGQCSTCRGTGRGPGAECTNCDGRGVCVACGGTGRVRDEA